MTFDWKKAAGYTLALAALVWVFHDVNPSVLANQLRNLKWWWLIPAIAADVLSYACEGMRWHLLLRPVGRLPVPRAIQAIYAGLFTNEVAPLRFGEVVRAYLASRWIERPVAMLIPSMVVGRLIDGIWLAAGFAWLLARVPLPADLAYAGRAFGIVIAVLVVLFAALSIRPPGRMPQWARIGSGANLGWAAAFSFGLLLLQAAAFWFVTVACRMPVSFASAAAVLLIVRLGTALPNAPANIGSFQFFVVLGLRIFGVEKGPAAAFSAIVFLVLTLPLWAIGLAALARSGVSIASLRAELAGAREPDPVAP